MPFYGAYPPELNSGRLSAGPGPAPMFAAAKAYGAVAAGMKATAGGSEGLTSAMAATWQGDSANRAQSAFREHNVWLHSQAMIAAQVAGQAFAQATAYSTALASMPPLAVILANRAVTTALVASNSLAQNTPAIAANETLYLAMWVQAAAVMETYDAATAVNTVLPLNPAAPPITSAPYPQMAPIGSPTIAGGLDSALTGPQSLGAEAIDAAANTVPDVAQAAEAPISELTGLTDPLAEAPFQGLESLDGPTEQMGFPGTSPTSPTLAALSGGAGSMVALGMVRGGIGTMSGASTGFRMPSNWRLGTQTKAFGAIPQAAPFAPVAPRKPPTGAIAPRTGRRRDRDEEHRTGTVFAPGTPGDVPVLERPPAIGVLEHFDDDPEDSGRTE
ncbi:PPE family protein [Nocardia sp. NPDC127579]|uniref:PPE family protein n=1 Tax=Nocardia sp. NPDC127579 TaxID=3345402 RepID=UPI00363DDD0A